MTLRSFAAALGGEISGDRVLAPGPGHSCRDRSMAVWLDANSPDGFRCHSFAGDDFKLCRDHVRERLAMPGWRPGASGAALDTASGRTQVDPQRETIDRERIDRAMTIWKEAMSPRGTPVELYLRHRRLSLPQDVLKADALRFHPACPFRLDDGTRVRLPTMLGLMRDIKTNEPRAIHRTALKEDGSGKSELPGLGNAKKMLGPSRNAVVKLTSDDDVIEGLGVAEGIETGSDARLCRLEPDLGCADLRAPSSASRFSPASSA